MPNTARHNETQPNTAQNGNTDIHSVQPTKESRGRKWCFTINNPNETHETQLNRLYEISVKSVWQKEKGEKGTIHYQGYTAFKNAKKLSQMKLLLTGAHFELCRNEEASILYCQKEEGYVGNRTLKGVKRKVQDPLAGVTPYPWQQQILDIIHTHTHTTYTRDIYWFWEKDGNSGKTSLAKSICLSKGNDAIYVSGKSADIKYALAIRDEEGMETNVVIIDIPRCFNSDYLSYEAIESIVNGIFFSTKYKAVNVIINSPTVIIFSNEPPKLEKVSADRWKVYKINKDTKTAVLQSNQETKKDCDSDEDELE